MATVRTTPVTEVDQLAIGQVGVLPSGQLVQGSDEANTERRPSNQRFRSFAERYVIERCRLWPADCDIDKMAWETINQARTIYNMTKEQGRTVTDE